MLKIQHIYYIEVISIMLSVPAEFFTSILHFHQLESFEPSGFSVFVVFVTELVVNTTNTTTEDNKRNQRKDTCGNYKEPFRPRTRTIFQTFVQKTTLFPGIRLGFFKCAQQ